MNKKIYNLTVTTIRILLLISVIILVYIILTNLDAIKLLNSDPCAICMEEGCECWCGNITSAYYNNTIDINMTIIYNYLNVS